MLLMMVIGTDEHIGERVSTEPRIATGVKQRRFRDLFARGQKAQKACAPLLIYRCPGVVTVGFIDPRIHLIGVLFMRATGLRSGYRGIRPPCGHLWFRVV